MSKYSTVNPIWPCTVQNCNRHQKKICPCLPLIGCYSVLRPLTLDATMLRRQKTYRVQCTWFLTWFLEGWRRANSAGLLVWTEACCSESSGEGSQTEHLHSPRITSPVKTKCPGGCDKGWKKSHWTTDGQLLLKTKMLIQSSGLCAIFDLKGKLELCAKGPSFTELFLFSSHYSSLTATARKKMTAPHRGTVCSFSRSLCRWDVLRLNDATRHCWL